MTLLPPDVLTDAAALVAGTYDDVVTFQADAGGMKSGEDWQDHADLAGLPASVTPVSADEEPDAGRYVGQAVYRVDFDKDAAAGVTADAVHAGLRVRVHARSGFAARVLSVVAPGEDVQRLGRWVRVLAVDEGATS